MEQHSVENTVQDVEHGLVRADGKLSMLAWNVDNFERDIQDPDKEVSVFKLLNTVTKVREDYSSLRQEILELQQLQRQLSASVRAQINQVQGRYAFLRSKLTRHIKSS